MRARDLGLQPERTSLAWRRTALSLAFNAILFVRAGLQERHAGLLAAGVGLCAGAALIARMSAQREAVLRRGFRPVQPWLLPVVACLTAVAAFVAAVSLGAR